MLCVEYTASIAQPAQAIWQVLRAFGRISDWHPAIVHSELSGNCIDDEPGCLRHLRLADGGELRERLLQRDDVERRLAYCIEASPLPLVGYQASVSVLGAGEQTPAQLHWVARFEVAQGASAEHCQALVRELIVSGHHALDNYLRG